LRAHAAQRGVTFLLGRSEFEEWCKETNYVELKGRFKDDMSVDRLREGEPYSIGNIQILTVGENAAKIRAHEKAIASTTATTEPKPF
jgi:hypothetical protein